MRRSEVGFIVAVILVFGGFVAADWVKRPPAPAPDAGRAPVPFLSGTSYCPAPGPEQAGEGVDSILATTNFGGAPVRLRRSTAGGKGTSRFDLIDLGARRRSEISAGGLGAVAGAGVVEAFGPAAVTDQLVLAPASGAASPRCSNRPAGRWLFANGSTARGKDTYLLLANPFEEEARVGVKVITPSEETVPSLLKNLVVPGLTEMPVLMAEFFQETSSFGLEVEATRGRVIVSRLEKIVTRDGLRGMTLAVGVRGPSTRWLFPGGEVPPSGEESIVLVNPGDRESLIRIVFLTDGESITPPALQDLPVPAGRQVTVKVSDHLPRGALHGTIVTSSNAVPLVAERTTLRVGGGADAVLGLTENSPRWATSAGSPVGGSDSLAVINSGRSRAVVRVVLITDQGEVRPGELAAVSIDSNRRATIDLTPFLGGKSATALVEALAGSIAVERHLVLGEPYRDFADALATPF